VIRLKLSDETKTAQQLETVSSEYPDVSAGSYPVMQQPDGAGVLISLECKDKRHLECATARFLELIEGVGLVDCVVTVENDAQSILHDADEPAEQRTV